MKNINPILYMLVGVPGSGKSTWAANELLPKINGVVIYLSTDDYIEDIALVEGKTYSQVFSKHIGDATKDMMERATSAFKSNLNVVWDQTNLTIKSRASKLAMVPQNYYKNAVYFKTPFAPVWRQRLEGRPGKVIPVNILMKMDTTKEVPTLAEGFDQIIKMAL